MSAASRSEKVYADVLITGPGARLSPHRISSEPSSPTTTGTGSHFSNSAQHKFPFPQLPQQVPICAAAPAPAPMSSQVGALFNAYLQYFQLFEKLAMISSAPSASLVSPPAPESPPVSAASASPNTPPDRSSQSSESQSAKRAKFSIASLLESDRRAPDDEQNEPRSHKCRRSCDGMQHRMLYWSYVYISELNI